MAVTNLFMLFWGMRLVHTTWYQAIADFPLLSVGISYLPVPVGGAITLLFVIERLWTGDSSRSRRATAPRESRPSSPAARSAAPWTS